MIVINEENKQGCCGCGACAQLCPTGCIRMQEDSEGFLYPVVDEKSCCGCGACEAVCPELSDKRIHKSEGIFDTPLAYGGWHKDEAIRYNSSSGGIFTLLAQQVFKSKGVVCGALMDEGLTIRHGFAKNMEELDALRKSKYAQSDTGNAFKAVKSHLDSGRTVLFSGTPCQCAGLKSFLNRDYDRLYIMDFICHGVPSPMVFRKYTGHLSDKYGSGIKNFHFRLKDRGWSQSGQSGTCSYTEDGQTIRKYPVFADSYMNGFLDDIYLRPACYSCTFKGLPKAYSDITIADFWGVGGIDSSLYDKKGTSLVLIHNEKGRRIFEEGGENFNGKPVDLKKAVSRNKSILQSPPGSRVRKVFYRDLEKRGYAYTEKKYLSPLTRCIHLVVNRGFGLVEGLSGKILGPVFKALGIRMDEMRWKALHQFIRFGIVGVSNVLVALTTNYIILALIKRFNLPVDYIIGNSGGFFVSVLWSYYWNSSVVFSVEQNSLKDRLLTILKSYITYAFTGLVLNNLLSTLWIKGLGISKFIAPLLNLPFSVPINFMINKFWTYRKNVL